jgi:toxin ParE1/3/4
MPREIIWSPQALADIETAFDYLVERNPTAAIRIYNTIMQDVEALAAQPFLGRVGRISGTRELVVKNTPFIVPYRVYQQTLEIIRVFHTARAYPQEF